MVYSQDIQLTQFYSSPLYLGPSFAGSSGKTRLVLNYRSQWAKLPRAYQTSAVSIDHYFPDALSGVGLQVIKDAIGNGKITTTSIRSSYAYHIKINRFLEIIPGIQIKRNSMVLDYYQLMFKDQIINNTTSSSIEKFSSDKVNYLDFSTSAAIFYAGKYWGGFCLDHLLTPNESFMGYENNLPLKLSSFGGARIPLKGRFKRHNNKITEDLVFAYFYKGQKRYNQLDIGLYFEKTPMVVGMWYRGLPLFKSNKYGVANQDAISFIIGISYMDFHFGYSHDITISKLNGYYTGGSNEFSLIYEYGGKKHDRNSNIVCPKF